MLPRYINSWVQSTEKLQQHGAFTGGMTVGLAIGMPATLFILRAVRLRAANYSQCRSHSCGVIRLCVSLRRNNYAVAVRHGELQCFWTILGDPSLASVEGAARGSVPLRRCSQFAKTCLVQLKPGRDFEWSRRHVLRCFAGFSLF